MNNSILLIGKPHSSKTVFLTQFYSRLQKKQSTLSLYKPVEDLSPIASAREALANGDEPQTTPAEKSVKFLLPIQIGEWKVDLRCPEYGGEQVNAIVENRELNKDWEKSIEESNNWVLFIRLNSINGALDISDITYSEQHQQKDGPSQAETLYEISDQSFFIELLQLLLHSKKIDSHLVFQQLKLTVVLTCWDELKSEEKPLDLLRKRLPLLLTFIESNWGAAFLNVIGLSAQGFPLNTMENKEKYQIDGPEKFGYLVFPDGKQTADITLLIEQSL